MSADVITQIVLGSVTAGVAIYYIGWMAGVKRGVDDFIKTYQAEKEIIRKEREAQGYRLGYIRIER